MIVVPEINNHYAKFGLWSDERLGCLMTSAAARWEENEFICIEDRRYTYGDIHRWTTAAAHDLVRRGVGPGDRVLLHLANCIELIVLQMAAWRIGAISVPVVPIYREHEMRHILADSQPRAVVAMKSFSDRAPVSEFDRMFADKVASPSVRIAMGGDCSATGWDAPLPCPRNDEQISEDGLPEPATADSVSLYLYTSGTTSAPKGAMLTGRALLSNADNWRLTLSLSPDDVGLAGGPLAHIAALCSAILANMRSGGRAVVMSSWKGDRAAELIVAEGVTFMAGASVFLQDLVECYENGLFPPPSGKLLFISGGAPTAPSLVERADRVGIIAVPTYGMTETAGTLTLGGRDATFHHRTHFDGRIEFGAEFKIVDDDGVQLPFGEFGHVLVRSPQLMVGYTDPVATAAQLDAEGWFRTGDIGAVTAEGWFRMNGRTKDIINRGGEKFSSLDIEMALLSHPDIARAAVVGTPHPRLGEEVAAGIVLRQGAAWAGPDSLLTHLASQQLAKQKMPVRWRVLEQLPMTTTGKVQKQVLLRLFEQEQADGMAPTACHSMQSQ